MTPMKVILGSLMRPAAQAAAKASFVHRFTGEHKPAWALQKRPDGTACPLQFASDADWLAHTFFLVTEAGELSVRRNCDSRPTWPNNPELRKPFDPSKVPAEAPEFPARKS